MSSALLPVTIVPRSLNDEVWLYMKELGFRYGRSDPETDGLHRCQLPEGWVVRSVGQPYHQEICDDIQRVRFVVTVNFISDPPIVYLQPEWAIKIAHDYVQVKSGLYVKVDALMFGETIYSIDVKCEDIEEVTERKQQLHLDVENWLQSNFPDFRDIRAYWDYARL